MTYWFEPTVLWLADFYLAATILLTAVAAVFAVVKQPARRVAVAWGTLLGLLVAAVLCQSASRPRLALRHLLSNPGGKAAEIQTTKTSLPLVPILTETAPPRAAEPERLEPRRRPVEQSAAIMPLSISSAAKERRPPALGQLAIGGVVLSFLAGTLLMGAWLSLDVFRAARLVRQSEPARKPCLDALRTIVGPSTPPPRLGVNKRLLMPVATGALRPAILLPEGFAQPGRVQELRAVLAHEWAHIKNGDLWLLAVDRLLLALLWAHPLYWWTRRRLRADQELLADAAAASQMGTADYAALLVTWTRQVAAQRGPAVSTAVGIWEGRSGLEQRVTALLEPSNRTIVRTSGRTRIGVAAAMTVSTLFATMFSLRPPRVELVSAQDQPTARDRLSDAKPSLAKTAESRPRSNDVGGTCRDNDRKPIAGVRVALYSLDKRNFRQTLVQQASTDGSGRFIFQNAPATPPQNYYWHGLLLVARRDGLASVVKSARRGEQIDVVMPRSVSCTGRIVDQKGKPIPDAIVSLHGNPDFDLSLFAIEGVRSAKTNARGEYRITDLAEYKYVRREVRFENAHSRGTLIWGPPYLRVNHPDYVRTQVPITTIPGGLNMVLAKGATIRGQILRGTTAASLADRLIFIQPVEGQSSDAHAFWAFTRTDGNGRYRVDSLPGGKFNILLEDSRSDVTAAAIDSLVVLEGQTVEAPPLRLVKGGVVKGIVIDDANGKPVHHEESELLDVQIKGPSRPWSGAAVDVAEISKDGQFEIRLPPGTNWLALRTDNPDETFESTSENGGYVSVPDGGEVRVEYHVRRVKPPKAAPSNHPRNRSE